ncbi:MAG: type II toxin-antitoxin system VapB family antitoxin [Verrucomicrobia bacterium]|nr:type II toxin-antitoxin system VapB family antitoxin [Verrucomicrobiota bacterium]
MHMKTNIDPNDDLVREARKYSQTKTKRALIEEALTALIRQRAEEQRRATFYTPTCAGAKSTRILPWRFTTCTSMHRLRSGSPIAAMY